MGLTELLANRLAIRPVEFEAMTGLGKSTVKKMVKTGEIKSFRSGRNRLIPVEEVRLWMERCIASTDQRNT